MTKDELHALAQRCVAKIAEDALGPYRGRGTATFGKRDVSELTLDEYAHLLGEIRSIGADLELAAGEQGQTAWNHATGGGA